MKNNNLHPLKSTSYPFDGEMFYPKKEKYKETIILTHHYGGHKKQMKRHVKYLNEIGFKSYVFNLFPQPFKSSFQLLKTPQLYYKRLSSIWSDQFLKTLSYIKGDKIIYSFSFSGNITSQVAYKDPTIKALIFDGGPFAQPIKSSWLYLSYQEVVKNPILRALCVVPWNLFFNFFLLKSRIHHALKKLPQNFPILSFQCVNDKLVPPEFTQTLLNPHTHLDMTTYILKNVQHLQGLKTDPITYKNALKIFLEKNSTLILN